jgi:nucleoid DNA-binding protein
MDIDLFSDIVKNLIVDNDEVALPGLGTFVSELMPSTFSDKGYTINPPYRRLSFRQRWNEGDTLLLDFYSQTNGTDKETSERIISGFLSGLKEMLQTKKAVQLPGLGRLRATKENTFFFIADEDLDIYQYGFGLEPVSLKSHEETPEEVATAVQELHELVSEPEVQVTAVDNGTGPEEQQDKQDSQGVQKAAKGPVNPIAVFLLILAVALAALLVFTIVARLSPGIFDSILYTPEELRIINY